MTNWTVCVLICALSVGCQSEQDPAVDEAPKADVQTKPSNRDKKFTLQKISEILLIEDLDDPIGVIKGLRIDQDRIYLMDTSQKKIMVFTIEGQFVRTIGRQGGGPGEFRQLFTMDVRDGLIAGFDQARRRITLFDSSGVFLNSFGARTKASAPSGNCLKITSDQTLLLAHKSSKSPREQREENRYPG